jgi:hypothetical protein
MTAFLGSQGLVDFEQKSLASKFKFLFHSLGKSSQEPLSCCGINCVQSDLLEVSRSLMIPQDVCQILISLTALPLVKVHILPTPRRMT